MFLTLICHPWQVPHPNLSSTTTPTPHPIKIKKCSVFNENWYRDQIRCEENENVGPDDRRPLERPGPTPPNFQNVRFALKIATNTIVGTVSPKMMAPTIKEGLDPHLATVAKDESIVYSHLTLYIVNCIVICI